MGWIFFRILRLSPVKRRFFGKIQKQILIKAEYLKWSHIRPVSVLQFYQCFMIWKALFTVFYEMQNFVCFLNNTYTSVPNFYDITGILFHDR